MPGPLAGIRVVEMGFWVAGPSAAAILADWGAEVVKLEPPTGDPFRGLFASALGAAVPINPPFEIDNRGKRSVALDLDRDEGRTVARQLLDRADVFVSNVRPRVLEQFGLAYDALRERNPGLIYCQITGYGMNGMNQDRAAYDIGAFWSRAGVAMALTAPGHEIPQQRGGMGDHMAGQAAAGAISAALFARTKSGRGQKLSVSLLRTGTYMLGWDLSLLLRLNLPLLPYDRFHAVNPIINSFQDRDGRWFWLLLLQADRHWPDLCRSIGREDLLADARFADIVIRRNNAEALVRELDAVFAQKSLDEWAPILDAHDVWWAPVQTIDEVAQDPVAHEAGVFVDVEGPEGPVRMVATPADFAETPAGPQGLAPELGQHTEEVLLELGYDWDRIIAFKDAGVIP